MQRYLKPDVIYGSPCYAPVPRFSDWPTKHVPSPLDQAPAMAARDSRIQDAIDADPYGCCGGVPMSDGLCFGVGACPLVKAVERIVEFTQGSTS